MNYTINKTYTCKTYNDKLIIKQYTKTRFTNHNNKYRINGAWVLFNNKEEFWNNGKIYNFIENWC